eukprot:6596248-Prymnesium_polylepis.1
MAPDGTHATTIRSVGFTTLLERRMGLDLSLTADSCDRLEAAGEPIDLGAGPHFPKYFQKYSMVE